MPVNIVTGAMKYKDTNGDYQDITGVKGATFTPAVSPEGILSWSNDSNLTNPDSVNIKGMVNNSVQIHETVTGPADIVTIQDGADGLPVTDLKVKIEPLQDLHGYDSPWPGGGGKNLINPSNCAYDIIITTSSPYPTDQYPDEHKYYLVNIPSIKAGTYTFSTNLPNCNIIRYRYTDNTSNAVMANVQEVRQSITIAFDADITNFCISLRNSTTTVLPDNFWVQFESGSITTDYAPYENICPISGQTNCNVSRTGLNLLENISKTNGKFLNAYGVEANDPNFWYTDLIPVEVGKTYYFTGKSTINGTSNRRIHEYDSTGTWIRQATYIGVTNNGSYNLDCTIPSGTAYIKASYGINDEYATLTDIPNEIYPISWQSEVGTVYGGELNVTTGELKATHVYELIPSNGYGYSSGYDDTIATQRFYTSEYNTYNNAPIISDRLKSGNANTTANTCMVSFLNRIHFRISNDIVGITSDMTKEQRDAALGTWFTNNPTHVCFELSEPVIYQLTPSQITTLLGTNHIWADTGDILSLTYSADPKMYVDQNKGVADVQVNGTSVVTDGVANVPIMSATVNGVAKLGNSNGLYGLIVSSETLMVNPADDYAMKTGSGKRKPVTSEIQHQSVFYGLAKAAGADMKNVSGITVGIYPEAQKSAISTMLNGSVSVSGTTPSITALPGVRYICGECSTLSITVPESGIIDVTFTSGSTATVLTVTPPTGMIMHWANGFDPTNLDADTIYEINIMDGCYGVVGTWT